MMTWIMINNTSKASCGLNQNPALRIDKYPLCPVYGTCFQMQVRIQILHLSFMNYSSHHVLTNYSIYIFLCQQIILWKPFSNFWMPFSNFWMPFSHFWMPFCNFWMSFSSFWMFHSLPLFFKEALTYIVGFELTTADLLPVDSNTLPLCHRTLRTCVGLLTACQ